MQDLLRGETGTAPRKRGRPPRTIKADDLVEALKRLFAQGGLDAVTIERTAKELAVSRATLYRSVPSKQHLLGILFSRMNKDLSDAAREVANTEALTPRERLEGLLRVQIDAAIRMRDYFFVFFDGSQLTEDVYDEWRGWLDDYEAVWLTTVSNAIDSGDLPPGDPRLTMRLILGMTIWVANWFDADEEFTSTQIQDRALDLLTLLNKTK